MGLADWITPDIRSQLVKTGLQHGGRYAAQFLSDAFKGADGQPEARAQHAPVSTTPYAAMSDPLASAILHAHRYLRVSMEHEAHRRAGCDCLEIMGEHKTAVSNAVVRAITVGTTPAVLLDADGNAILEELNTVATNDSGSMETKARTLSRLVDRVQAKAEREGRDPQ